MKLIDVCEVIRSKNSGPFELTFDLIFTKKEDYENLKNSEKITKESFAKLYGIDEADVLNIVWFEPSTALKITINRPMASGDISDKDIYGAGQHSKLLKWEL